MPQDLTTVSFTSNFYVNNVINCAIAVTVSRQAVRLVTIDPKPFIYFNATKMHLLSRFPSVSLKWAELSGK